MRRLATVSLAVSLLATGVARAPAADAKFTAAHGVVSVLGDVADPTSYTAALLRALPQTTVTDTRSAWGETLTGVSLADLVQDSHPNLDAGKNPQLRVVITVTGTTGSRTIAFGELDPGFGNHPALLALTVERHALPGAPDLAVPGDDGYARTVVHVRRVSVAVITPDVPTDAPAGGVIVTAGTSRTAITAATLAALPQQSATVSYLSGGGPQTHTESGPTLADVLRAAHLRATSTTAVTAVGTDGYAATVTPAEATSGRRLLLLSTVEDGTPLTQPRLIPDGDSKGGRYVSDVIGLTVTTTSPRF